MNAGGDKFSRIISLKPVAPRVPPQARLGDSAGGDRGRLAEMLGAERRITPRGRHLLSRRRLETPRLFLPDPRALRLLLPGDVPESADPARWLFLDTETTGLAGGTGTYAFLIGVARWEAGGFLVEQLFMEDHGQEASMLSDLAERLGDRSVLVTFNGKSFDCPLLETRFRMTRLGGLPAPRAHLDLLHPARTLWRLRLKSVAQAELERHVLGLERGPDIPSESIPGRYFSFLRGGPAWPVAEVFEHNLKDLQGLAALAAHMLRLLAEEPGSREDPAELFGISRLLQRRGDTDGAFASYQRALSEGLEGPAQQSARRELALLSRRRRNFPAAREQWAMLLDDSRGGMEAYQQLAIYHEHHAGDPEEAARITREALVRLQGCYQAGKISPHQYRRLHEDFHHRLARLSRKGGV